MRNQKGFTLIELIIVIVVLGILAVTAAPQFINFSNDARTSTVKGLKGALQGAAQTVYARAAIDNDLGGTPDSTITVNSVTTSGGYPTATAGGIKVAASLDDGDWATLAVDGDSDPATPNTYYVGPASYIPNGGASESDFTAADGTNGCYASYTETADSDTPPTITTETSGC